jgi:hypothetical protein
MRRFFFFLICPLLTFAQAESQVFTNKITKKEIHTVLLHPRDFEMASPILALNSGEQLKLSFDDFSANINSYSYTLIHCTPDWKASTIWSSEYIKGYTEFSFSSYEYSFNTKQKYIHYSETFPHENMQITKSGNYIIKVFQDGNMDNVAFTYRFMVVDQKLGINLDEHYSSIPGEQYYKHEVDFTIAPQQVNLTDPFSELKVVLLQNYNWNTAITNLKPQFITNDLLTYNYSDINSFNAGNEFRYFDTRSLRFHSERILNYNTDAPLTTTDLKTDDKRNFLQYRLYQDLDGMRYIKVQEGSNSDIEADYTPVHFTLNSKDSIASADVYVYGALTDWQYLPEAKMKYNWEKHQFETTLLLKQGYYNYIYTVLKNGTPDEVHFEGTFYQTEDVYQALVYYKSVIGDYWQLVGTSLVKSTLR